jgi:maleate isomerase
MVTPTTVRLGVVVPSGNAAVEPEIAGLLHGHVGVYAARFPVFADHPQRSRIARYNDVLGETIASFGSLRPAAVVAECSGSHYLQGPEAEARFCDRLSDKHGCEVTTVTRTVLSALAAIGADEVTLVSPYAPWLTELSVGYWKAAGIKVRDVVKVQSAKGFSPYDVTTEELVEQVLAADRDRDEVLLATGTGMPTLAALRELNLGADRTLLTSNLCTAWWAARTLLPANAGDVVRDWPLPRSAFAAGLA